MVNNKFYVHAGHNKKFKQCKFGIFFLLGQKTLLKNAKPIAKKVALSKKNNNPHAPRA